MEAITLCFIGDHGEVHTEKKITSIPLNDDFVIQKSIEYFHDPEPCMIHRSAVMKRIYMQIQEFFLREMQMGRQQVPWDELPCFVKEAFDLRENVQSVVVKKKIR